MTALGQTDDSRDKERLKQLTTRVHRAGGRCEFTVNSAAATILIQRRGKDGSWQKAATLLGPTIHHALDQSRFNAALGDFINDKANLKPAR